MNAFSPITADARVDLSDNCTLETYACSKMLPVEFLRSLGVANVSNPYAPQRRAISIPYFNADGSTHRDRIRAALLRSVGADGRMLWDRMPEGHGTVLYGLNLVNEAGRVLLVEGESDAQTLWLHGYAALGLPGSSNFNPARDDRFLEGREIIALREPDVGGLTLIRTLMKSAHRARIRVAVLEGFKDVSDMHTGRDAYGAFAHAEDILHIPIITSRGEHAYKGFHIQNVNAYASRLKDWLRPFKGVASRYLPSYLGWRRAIERLGENFTAERCLQIAYRCAST